MLLPDTDSKLESHASQGAHLEIDSGIAQWAFDKTQPAGFGTDTLPASAVLYLPLRAPMRTRGVLAVQARHRRLLMIPEQRRQLDTFAALIAIALERVHYVEVAQQTLVRIESERLRNSLLAALSHDLRTPLAALVGLADSFSLTQPPLSAQQSEIAEEIREEARRMNTLVANLLDMARIESGEVKLNLQWQPFEEVVGSALNSAAAVLKKHQVEVNVPHDLPLARFDALSIERVLVNLLENAAKYTAEGSRVRITAQAASDTLRVTVADNGPGLPRGREQAIFEKFMRGARESATPGVGLGLAICRAIVEAHSGRISAANKEKDAAKGGAESRTDGGASFTFTLPLGKPPDTVAEPAEPAIADG